MEEVAEKHLQRESKLPQVNYNAADNNCDQFVGGVLNAADLFEGSFFGGFPAIPDVDFDLAELANFLPGRHERLLPWSH